MEHEDEDVQNINYNQSHHSRFAKDYSQLSIIGHGHFGTVYKCRNNYDKQIYAIKCTKSKYRITNWKTEAVNEAQALAFLSAKGDSPYIVRYYTSWTEGNALYLAMELCDASVKRIIVFYSMNIPSRKRNKKITFASLNVRSSKYFKISQRVSNICTLSKSCIWTSNLRTFFTPRFQFIIWVLE